MAALDAGSDAQAIGEVNRAFRDYLITCQRDLGLWQIQPGRFVHPGDLEDLSVLEFSPTPAEAPQAIRSAMRERYDAYKRDVVRKFYTDHFQRFDRQIVLVDLLGLLNAGPDHFTDAQAGLARIMESFRYGQENLLGRLFSPSIDRVVFAVSKADHVAGNQHPNLKQLMELMIAEAARRPRFEGIEYEVLAIAALRSTDTVRTEHHGQMLSCVRGRLKDEARETVLFPGEIPHELPDEDDWRSGRFRFREFAPRPMTADMTDRHIRLDQAIEHLIGDKLG
jgi:predicted YcjX-like family ATPase